MSGGGGGGGSSNTVTNQVQIPAYEQQFSSENQDLARSLASNPYPAYNAPLVQQFSPQQEQGMQMAGDAATAYQPDLNAASQWTQAAIQNSWPSVGAGQTALSQGANVLNAATQMGPNNQTIGQYMSPYVQQALAPQVAALQAQEGQQQNAINAQATQAGAFGDARQGAEQALQNFYGDQALSGLVGQGYNTAYSNALQTALSEQQQQGQLGQALGSVGQSLGNLGLNVGQQQLAGANQLAQLGGMQQSLGISGANALFNAGQQQQTLGQQELNTAYQQFLNQANWPYQMLNIRESALSNSPYNMVNATTVPQANMTAQGFGAGLGALGSLGAMLGGGSSGANAPFGGTAFPGSR